MRAKVHSSIRWYAQAALDIALLLLLTLIFFWPVLFTNHYGIPYDILEHHFPFRFFIADILKKGQLPLWTPYLFSGYPGLGDPEWAVFYPPNLLLSFLSPGEGLSFRLLEWQAVMHHFLAGFSMYILTRYLLGSRFASLVAAVAYMFGGFFVTHTPLLPHINVLAWFPLLFLLFHIALKKRSYPWAILTGAIFGWAILAGYVNAILNIAYVFLAYLGYRLYRPLVKRSFRQALNLVGLFITTGGVAFGLAAILLIPSVELSSLSIRAGQTIEEAATSSLIPMTLITLFIPNFFSYEGPSVFWATSDLAESYNYMGVLVLILALLAMLNVRKKAILILVGFSLFSLFAAFGSWTFFHQFSFYFLPGFDKIRRPFNAIIFFQFGLALLAGYGARFAFDEAVVGLGVALERLWRGLRWAGVVVLIGGGIFYWGLVYTVGTDAFPRFSAIVNGLVIFVLLAITSLGILFIRARGLFDVNVLKAAAFVFIIFDLFTFGSGKPFNTGKLEPDSIGPKAAYDGSGYELLEFLKADEDYLRAKFYRVEARETSWLWRNTPTLWGIPDTGGGSNLQLLDYASFRAQILSLNSRLLDFLGVKYVVSRKPLDKLDPQVNRQKFETVFDGVWKLYRNKDFLPRAFMVYEARVLKDKLEVLDALREPSFDPGKTALFQESVPAPGEAQRVGEMPAIVTITRYEPTRVDLKVITSRPGFLVTSEVYYPGWKALVNGEVDRIYRANQAFRALYLNGGSYEISFIFDPASFKVGTFFTGLTFLGLLVLSFGMAYRGARIRNHSKKARSP